MKTLSGSEVEGPGRPSECRCADIPAALGRRNSHHARAMIDCTASRTILRLTYLLVVVVSCVHSAPLPLQSTVDQQEGALSDGLEEFTLMEESLSLREEEEDVRERRAVLASGKWTNATIPFVFDTDTLTLVQRNRVIKAMKVWQKKTCVRFVERTDEEFFVKIYRDDAACHAEVGMKRFIAFRGRGQPMQLSQTYCLSASQRGKIIHELGHVIGLYHEHQRPDRGKYVEIVWQNLIQTNVIREQYEIVRGTTDLGSPYDYHSIMHYGPTDNTANGHPTMIILDPAFQGTLRNRTRPSQSDYRQVNLLYHCPEIDKSLDESDRRPNMLPYSANDIRSGDRLSLSPEIPDANTTWWLNCTDGCKISDAAGKKFKSDDVSECTELIFELHKVAGVMDSMYIKVGDTVVMKHQSMDQIDTVSCLLDETQCAYKPRCTDGGGCPSDTFVVGAVGKSVGQQIMHKDQLVFNVPLPESDVMMTSWMHCNDQSIEDGTCYKVNCAVSDNTFGALSPTSPLCREPFSFLVTKL